MLNLALFHSTKAQKKVLEQNCASTVRNTKMKKLNYLHTLDKICTLMANAIRLPYWFGFSLHSFSKQVEALIPAVLSLWPGITCDRLANNRNGEFQYSNENRFVGTNATYRCHNGYQLVNVSQYVATCREMGVWDSTSTPPECTGIWLLYLLFWLLWSLCFKHQGYCGKRIVFSRRFLRAMTISIFSKQFQVNSFHGLVGKSLKLSLTSCWLKFYKCSMHQNFGGERSRSIGFSLNFGVGGCCRVHLLHFPYRCFFSFGATLVRGKYRK